jgi:hypothetical protein
MLLLARNAAPISASRQPRRGLLKRTRSAPHAIIYLAEGQPSKVALGGKLAVRGEDRLDKTDGSADYPYARNRAASVRSPKQRFAGRFFVAGRLLQVVEG